MTHQVSGIVFSMSHYYNVYLVLIPVDRVVEPVGTESFVVGVVMNFI